MRPLHQVIYVAHEHLAAYNDRHETKSSHEASKGTGSEEGQGRAGACELVVSAEKRATCPNTYMPWLS